MDGKTEYSNKPSAEDTDLAVGVNGVEWAVKLSKAIVPDAGR